MDFLESELTRERETLRAVRGEVGHPYHEAVWMISLTIIQFTMELRWLKKVDRELEYRAPAQEPANAQPRERPRKRADAPFQNNRRAA